LFATLRASGVVSDVPAVVDERQVVALLVGPAGADCIQHSDGRGVSSHGIDHQISGDDFAAVGDNSADVRNAGLRADRQRLGFRASAYHYAWCARCHRGQCPLHDRPTRLHRPQFLVARAEAAGEGGRQHVNRALAVASQPLHLVDHLWQRA
jgi:hypothetical protein